MVDVREHELPELLQRAVQDVPEPDVAEDTWWQGRRSRRRRGQAGALGGLVAAALVGLAALQLPFQGGLLHPSGTERADPAGRAAEGLVLEPPETPDLEGTVWHQEPPGLPPGSDHWQWPPAIDAVSLQHAHDLWATLWTACLESRGYAVDVDGAALTMVRDGALSGDYTRDVLSCGNELRTDSPVVLDDPGGVRLKERSVLMNRWFQYDWTRQCLEENDLPTGPRPLADEFIAHLGWAQLPAWHPYLEMVQEGRYEEARDRCPMR